MGNCSGPVEEQQLFNQPVFQTVQMFLAESLVVLVVLINKFGRKRDSQGYEQVNEEATPTSAEAESDQTDTVIVAPKEMKGKRILLLALPATCDICGTTLMNVGLLVVPVSIFQMVRGAIVLFVGSFSVIFLKRTLTRKQWLGLLAVTAGVFVVGLSAVGSSGAGAKETGTDKSVSLEVAFGVLLILLAQVFTATQFVLEEFILEKYSMEPIKVVAWEGTFGTIITVFASMFIYTFFVKSSSSIFNLWEGTHQVLTIKPLLISSLVVMVALASFNVTGLTVTRVISATSRSTIDTCRTIGIWAVSLLIGWETFRFLQLVGFAMLVYGTLLFNGIIQGDAETKKRAEQLLPNEFEHT